LKAIDTSINTGLVNRRDKRWQNWK